VVKNPTIVVNTAAFDVAQTIVWGKFLLQGKCIASRLIYICCNWIWISLVLLIMKEC